MRGDCLGGAGELHYGTLWDFTPGFVPVSFEAESRRLQVLSAESSEMRRGSLR